MSVETTRSEDAKSGTRDRVRKYRAAQRAKGLRLIQMWIPDTRKPGFAEELHRQCLSLRADLQEKEVLDWIEQSMDYTGWK